MRGNSKTTFMWISVGSALLIILFREWGTLTNLNSIFFGNYFDALKNYYTVLYHVKWDESFFTFQGMNFPYYEHVLFTDNQPVISNFLKLLNFLGIPVENYTLGIINGMLLLSLLLATYFNFKCLSKLGVVAWLAAIVSVGLTFLSPQTDRINGHFALSYSFIIPLIIYQALLFIEKPTYVRSLIIGGIVVFVSFLHAYFLGFALLILGSLFLVILVKRQQKVLKYLGHLSLQTIVPLSFVEGIMIFSDQVVDRPAFPWSPFLSNFNLHGVFFPVAKPIGLWIKRNFGMPHVEWEAFGYVGMAATFFFLFATLASIYILIFARQKTSPFLVDKRFSVFLLITSLLALATPGTFTALAKNEWIYLHMGPVRQFRSIGRFNWIFYSSLNFMLWPWISAQLKNGKIAAWARIALVSISLFLLVNDVYWNMEKPFHENHTQALLLENTPEQKQVEELLAPYDVILTVPFFHIGSESFVYENGGGEHFKNAMVVSYASGKPLNAVMLSRTSLSQTLQSLQYSIYPVKEPAFVQQLQGKKAILLVTKGAELTYQEELLLKSGSNTIFEGESFEIIEFDLNQYKALYAADSVKNQYTKAHLSDAYYFKDFEESSEKSYIGSGVLSVASELPRKVDVIDVKSIQNKQTRMGFWVFLNEQNKAIESMEIRFRDQQNSEVGYVNISFRDNLEALDGHWGYVSFPLQIPATCNNLELSLKRNNLYPSTTFLDGLNLEVYEE